MRLERLPPLGARRGARHRREGRVPEELEGLGVLAHRVSELEVPARRAVQNGPTLIVNPGEAGGWTTDRATVGLLDLGTMEVEVLELRINGRPVGARIVEGAAPSTIIIVPDQELIFLVVW